MNGDLDLAIRSCMDRGTFALVGAGQLGEMALDLWPESLPPPKFFLDSNRRGKCRGIEVLSLQKHKSDPSVIYVLSAFKMSGAQAKRIFVDLGQTILLTVYDVFDHYCPGVFSNGWRCLDVQQNRLERIESVRSCFADSVSQKVFDAAVAWRYRRELEDGFTVAPEDDKYSLEQYGKAHGFYDLVYDCGAYDLSFAAGLRKAGVTFANYVAFEPDLVSYDRCVRIGHKLSTQLGVSIVNEKIAISDRKGTRPFISSGLLSARLLEDRIVECANTIQVQTDSLGAFHENRFRGSDLKDILVKLHVEGSEWPALEGARQMIEAGAVDMFINLSHNEASLIEIPQFLASMGHYDLHLRSHALFGEGLTLFARHRLSV